MSKRANAGELRTQITVSAYTETIDNDGYPVSEWKSVLTTWCKWVNLHGQEVLTAQQLGLVDAATLTMRYSPKIMPISRIIRGSDVFEIISIDNVEQRNEWLEVKVQRLVQSV